MFLCNNLMAAGALTAVAALAGWAHSNVDGLSSSTSRTAGGGSARMADYMVAQIPMASETAMQDAGFVASLAMVEHKDLRGSVTLSEADTLSAYGLVSVTIAAVDAPAVGLPLPPAAATQYPVVTCTGGATCAGTMSSCVGFTCQSSGGLCTIFGSTCSGATCFGGATCTQITCFGFTCLGTASCQGTTCVVTCQGATCGGTGYTCATTCLGTRATCTNTCLGGGATCSATTCSGYKPCPVQSGELGENLGGSQY